jgi:hypothetical protein
MVWLDNQQLYGGPQCPVTVHMHTHLTFKKKTFVPTTFVPLWIAKNVDFPYILKM